jgi:hypothetical protein
VRLDLDEKRRAYLRLSNTYHSRIPDSRVDGLMAPGRRSTAMSYLQSS